jgi:cell division protease FtsH
MDEKVGQRTYAPAPQPFLGVPTGGHGQAAEITTREIDVAVRDLIEKGFTRARDILTTRRADLDAGAQLLLKRETITVDDFPAIRSARAVTESQLALVPAAS